MNTEKGAKRHSVRAADAQSGMRLDRLLAGALAGLSRSRLKKLIETGQVRSGGATITDPSARVKPGQNFDIDVPPATPARPLPQDIPLDILYEDAHVIVLDKPPGLVVHPAAGNPDRTLVNALLAHCGDSLSGIGGVKRPGIVHRLDKDTSGLMVVAKNDKAHASLSAQFADRTIERAYLAVVRGVPSPARGKISAPIGRSPRNRKKMTVLKRGGRPAVTRYHVLERLGGAHPAAASLVECRLETGRTHQIRVHMNSLGHPLIGDPVYGHSRRKKGLDPRLAAAMGGFKRQALHACIIGFRHPENGGWLRFEKKIPSDMNELVSILDGM